MSILAGKESTATMTGRPRATPVRKPSGATPEDEHCGAPPHGSDAVLGALERLSELQSDEVVPRLVGDDDEVVEPMRPMLARVGARAGAARRIRIHRVCVSGRPDGC